MKKYFSFALVAALTTTAFAQENPAQQQEHSNKYGFTVESKNHLYRISNGIMRQVAEESVYDILSCKEGSVFGNEYSEGTYWTGSACADAGRPELGMEYYQHFDNCFYTFNEIRFLGFFNYYDIETNDWLYCHDRGAMNENMEMTEPVTFVIGIYEEGEDGLPGKCIMQKDINIIGEKTRVALEGMGNETQTAIYEFAAPLDQEINLEHGFIQINAKDMGDMPSCWFAVFTIGGNTFALQKDIINEEFSGQSACAFCLYGDGSLNAKKALEIDRFITPYQSANGKYEKVQVELTNIGANPINDARLELYVDDELIATENVNVTIESFESYKYTFNARINCSDGEHKITVKNVTPGDEQKAYQAISATTKPAATGEYPECNSRVPNVINITKVSLGDINNTSEGSTYSDYTDKKTAFRIGDKKTLNVEIESVDYEPTLGVFIDWNGDYNFSNSEAVVFDSFESDNNSGKATATISVPEGAVIGEHRMRLIAIPNYYTPDPATTYYNGEIEDYTIIVEPSPNDPVLTVNKTIIEQETDNKDISTEIKLTNSSNNTLNANIEFKYLLPNSPTGNYPAKTSTNNELKGKFKAAQLKLTKQKAPSSEDSNIQYVLKYDNNLYDCIGIGNSPSATFACLYPGAMLSNIEGMMINSVDVYVGDVPQSASIVIYGQNKQSICGELIAEKAFTPKEHSWNNIVLDKPVEIEKTDLWIGVKMNNINADAYCIGVDEGPAIIGFGDIVNIGGDTWWSMADLGLNYNYCIRANVTGNRTPAINWLSTDKKDIEVSPNTEFNMDINMSTKGLDNGLYEAYIEINSNDPLNSFVRIPVYMINGKLTAISKIENGQPSIMLNGGIITIQDSKTISNVNIFDLSGNSVMNIKVNNDETTIDLNSYSNGIYIMIVAYNDGSSISIKVPVLK